MNPRGYTAISIVAAVALVLAALFLGPILFPPGTGSAAPATAVPATPTPSTVCMIPAGTQSHDKTLVNNAIRKLQLPGVTDAQGLLDFFHITDKSVADIEVDSDCTSVQIPATGPVFSACKQTDFTFDGYRYAWQSNGTTLTGVAQIGFPTGLWDLEGVTFFPKPSGQPFQIVKGACT